MVIAVIAALLVLVPMLLLFFTLKERKSEHSDGHATHTGCNNCISRGEFVLTILIAYLLTALVVTAAMVVTQGMDGLAAGVMFSLYSVVFAGPVLLIAVIVGYSVFQLGSKIAAGFPGLWIGYSMAALVSASLPVLIIELLGPQSYGATFILLLVVPSVVLALPSSVVAWYRSKSRNEKSGSLVQ